MIHSLLLSAALAAAGERPEPAREAAQEKGWTVPGGASQGVKACHEDIERFCKDVEPGEGRLGRCLLRNKKKLSRRCRRWARHGGAAHEDASLRELDKKPGLPN